MCADAIPPCLGDFLDGHSEHPVLKEFSAEEIGWIVQIKRFVECLDGDPDFRREMESGEVSPGTRARLRRIGVLFDPREMALLWECPQILGGECGVRAETVTDEERGKLEAALGEYPLVDLWRRYTGVHAEVFVKNRRNAGFDVPRNPKFDAWRGRRIAATRHELGYFAYVIDHPILAFELGDGCSVGCWFCAFATRKLSRNFDYAENREFFREVIRACVELFGREQAAMALLYYGTEPHDNPRYLDFVRDHAEITGHSTCTSTAVCTDPDWIRSLIGYYRERRLPWPRLSVPTREALYRIHDLHTPGELRDVSLLMQMKDHRSRMVTGGRILEEKGGLRDREEGRYLDGVVPQGSIACVSGFLVNMVHRRIQAVSPCYTSRRWPYGYRVFDEIRFEGPDDFEGAVRRLIDRAMPEAPPPAGPARLRDDLLFRETLEGFDLISPNQVRHFRGKEEFGPVGSLLARGDLTFEELHRAAIEDHGLNPLLVMSGIRQLFDRGFLDEVVRASGDAP